MKKRIVFTCGDINGIGPEIIIKSLTCIPNKPSNKYYIICPPTVFESALKLTGQKIKYNYSDQPNDDSGDITVIPLKDTRQNTGSATRQSGKTAFDAIKMAVDFAKSGMVDAIVTAPISKTAISMAGINFPGHTEMLAEWTGTKKYVMTFLSKKMNASLVTIHEPLKKVPALITRKNIHSTIDVILNTLRNEINVKNPRIAVLGLNPHAGETGIIGKEEKEIIGPAIKNYPGSSEFLSGPFSPDAFFANRLYKKFDMVIGMFHDQVLIPFKLLNFGGGVNYTAGLPVIRTSPDHGVAYDIAGKNIADPSSMVEAVNYALKIINSRKKNAK